MKELSTGVDDVPSLEPPRGKQLPLQAGGQQACVPAMAKDKKGRSRDTVTREYTINLHKKLHNTNVRYLIALA